MAKQLSKQNGLLIQIVIFLVIIIVAILVYDFFFGKSSSQPTSFLANCPENSCTFSASCPPGTHLNISNGVSTCTGSVSAYDYPDGGCAYINTSSDQCINKNECVSNLEINNFSYQSTYQNGYCIPKPSCYRTINDTITVYTLDNSTGQCVYQCGTGYVLQTNTYPNICQKV